MAQSIHNNPALQQEIAAEVKAKTGLDVTAEDVLAVGRYGSVDEGNVGPEHDEARTEAILEALDAKGISV